MINIIYEVRDTSDMSVYTSSEDYSIARRIAWEEDLSVFKCRVLDDLEMDDDLYAMMSDHNGQLDYFNETDIPILKWN